jgi:predicted PurR-regulated permease PerM
MRHVRTWHTVLASRDALPASRPFIAYLIFPAAQRLRKRTHVVGKQVRLSAFIVMLSLLVGAEVAGLFGMLVAVPNAGVVRVLANRMPAAAKSS